MAWKNGKPPKSPGRPKGSTGTGRVQRCLRFMQREGWKGLERLARNQDPKVALEAIRLIAAYGIGKPREQIDVTSDGSLTVQVISFAKEKPAP